MEEISDKLRGSPCGQCFEEKKEVIIDAGRAEFVRPTLPILPTVASRDIICAGRGHGNAAVFAIKRTTAAILMLLSRWLGDD